MEKVIVAAGSNLGERRVYLQKASAFLEELSEGEIRKSSVWESEPVGGALYSFYNTAALIHTTLSPHELLRRLKEFEIECGREKNPKRWGPRVLDLDIIRYGNLVIHDDTLIIPHSEYAKRRFVLLPMKEIGPVADDPENGSTLDQLISSAPDIEIRKTDIVW
ncbi:MAG: 2-amino-4-hydroxy-6-hydroxymethyldihydropteridine diphosphokinase [Balneolaceae bacterium]|nr:2-amino-4-hydroxy-6-hydroxymethyldihydropteridine diphosphokinase [Balneolaceae bacterium]